MAAVTMFYYGIENQIYLRIYGAFPEQSARSISLIQPSIESLNSRMTAPDGNVFSNAYFLLEDTPDWLAMTNLESQLVSDEIINDAYLEPTLHDHEAYRKGTLDVIARDVDVAETVSNRLATQTEFIMRLSKREMDNDTLKSATQDYVKRIYVKLKELDTEFIFS